MADITDITDITSDIPRIAEISDVSNEHETTDVRQTVETTDESRTVETTDVRQTVDKKALLKDKLKRLRLQRGGKRRAEFLDTTDAANKNGIEKKDRNKLKKNVKAQKVDDILRDLGITDPATKTELIQAMENGRIKNVSDLSSWLALHAPLSQVRPQDVLAVREAAEDAERLADKFGAGSEPQNLRTIRKPANPNFVQ